MQQAVSYLQGMSNPFEGVLEAYGQGQGFRENRDILRAKQIEQARKEQAQLDVSNIDWNDRNSVAKIVAQYPEYTKGVKDWYDQMEAKEQQAKLSDMSRYISVLRKKRPELATTELREKARILTEGGNSDAASELLTLAQQIEEDPDAMANALSMSYAVLAGKDNAAAIKDTFATFNEQDKLPSEIAGIQATANKNNTDSSDSISNQVANAAIPRDPQLFSATISRMYESGLLSKDKFDQYQAMMQGTPEEVMARLEGLATQNPEIAKAFKPEINVVNTGATTDIVEYDPQTGQVVTRKQLQNTVSPNQQYSSDTNVTIAGINQEGQNQRANLAAETSRYNADQQALLKKYQIDVNDKQANQKLEYAYQQEDIKNKTAELKTINGKVWLFYPKLNKLRAVVNQNGQQLKDIKPNAVDAGKKRAEQQRIDKVNLLIPEMRKLLPQATGSYTGTATDKVLGAVGYATDGAKASAQLKALAGQLVSTMPRMEGPQSDKDVAMYQQMAGDIGDSTKTRAQRLAALDTIEKLNKKYDNLNNGRSNTANTSKFFK